MDFEWNLLMNLKDLKLWNLTGSGRGKYYKGKYEVPWLVSSFLR